MVTVVGTGTDATGNGVADTVLKLGTSNIVVLSKFTAWGSNSGLTAVDHRDVVQGVPCWPSRAQPKV